MYYLTPAPAPNISSLEGWDRGMSCCRCSLPIFEMACSGVVWCIIFSKFGKTYKMNWGLSLHMAPGLFNTRNIKVFLQDNLNTAAVPVMASTFLLCLPDLPHACLAIILRELMISVCFSTVLVCLICCL